ncbi:TIGR04140 family protein [Thermococcus peptonophilus]|uniref:TIGR04140 family protein n=1 Tax=Thermococcus peptonophilus TaxID=53952 RepID=A0A142CVG0_9EURY|nr:TIGR04140 family protein [Thermococcus peptonophilus]AMQ18762.1 TIGR04140 family protein [Thermococcus peptonophilus]
MKLEILTPIPLEELEELRRRSGAEVSLRLLEVTRRNRIPLNRVLIEGEEGEVKRFMGSLMRARAGG